MRNAKLVCLLVSAALLLPGCSTTPRNFTANLAGPVADRAEFEQNYRTCQKLAKSGRTSDFKANAATALATGAGTVGTGAAMAGTGLIGIGSSGGAAAAATAALPVVGFLTGFGVSRAIRSGKERKLKRAMTNCLSEYGYSVESWTRLRKKDDAARVASDAATIAASGDAIQAPY